MSQKINPFDIIIERKDKFPFKIYDSDFLKEAAEKFHFIHKTQEILNELLLTE